MIVIINGKQKDMQKNTRLNSLISDLGIKREGLIVEHNMHIVNKDSNPELTDGDRIELLKIRGGG
jgi:thiamine biosynthesis protein ThiS